MRVPNWIVKTLTVVLFARLSAGMAQTGWEVVKTFQIGGEGGWDYLTIDPQAHRLYVPRSTHTMVIDSESGKVTADIPGQTIAHGVAIVPEAGRGFISDGGGSGRIVIFDLKTDAVLGTIVAQPDADGIIFDRASGRVLVVSGDGGVLMSFKPDIDPKGGKIETPIELGGAPEFLASDGAGRVYVNLMDKNEVAVVDLKLKKVVARWPVAPGGAPVGMSIDTNRGLLFIGCRKPQKFIVMSTKDGKVLAGLPIGPSVDATKIDQGLAFASSAGALTVTAETSGGFEIVQNVTTTQGSRTMDLDPKTHKIYLPSADFGPPQPGKSFALAMKPGSFKILVIARRGTE